MDGDFVVHAILSRLPPSPSTPSILNLVFHLYLPPLTYPSNPPPPSPVLRLLAICLPCLSYRGTMKGDVLANYVTVNGAFDGNMECNKLLVVR